MYNKKRKRIILVITVSLIAVLTLFALWDYGRYKEDIENYIPAQTDKDIVYYDGEPYKYNSQIKNILILGIDNDAPISYQNMSGAGGQADCIMLLSMNQTDKTVKVIQVPRDSMTDIDIYDDNGNYHSTTKGQLALQYAYTNGARAGCWATKKTVSEFLYEIPIDGYIAVDIAAISKMNDILGGIAITMEEDYTAVDPAFEKGKTIKLTGEQAERFVRYRDTEAVGSSHERMQRQTQFLPALVKAAEGKIEQLYKELEKYIETNLSGSDIENIMTYSGQVDEYVFIEGEIKQGEEFEEFYPDEEKLKNMIIKIFYKKI